MRPTSTGTAKGARGASPLAPARYPARRMRVAAALALLVSALRADESGAIEGQLIDGDGKPVAGWIVTAFQLKGDEVVRRTAETDAEGRYRIADLPAGTYSVGAAPKPPPEKKPRNLEEAIGAAIGKAFGEALVGAVEAALGGGPRVTVAAGATARHDIRLPRVLDVEARVTSGGKPVAGAELKIFPVDADGNPSWTLTVGERPVPRSDLQGKMRIEGVKEGRHGIFCLVDEYEMLCGTFEARAQKDRAPVQLNIDLGTYSIRIRVLDANGRPVPEAQPSAWQGDDKPWADAVRTRDMKPIRRADGIYVLPYLKQGRYGAFVNVGDAHAEGGPVEVGPENPAPEVVVRLTPRGTLVVRTVDAQGKAVPNVQILVSDPSGTPSYNYPTDDAGEFRLDLSARAWKVGFAELLDWKGEPQTVEILPDRESRVDLVVR